jgi:8-oxo-dGTP diphosphatase
MESGESPVAALEREVLEETGYIVRAGQLLGIYAATYKDDLVLSIEAEIIGREAWEPNAEIAEVGFFAQGGLPQPMHSFAAARICDAFEGRTGVIRVTNAP